jgi:hypothetical protein
LTENRPLEQTLVRTGAIDEKRLQEELARWDGPVIQNVVPVLPLVAKLPKGICRRLVALPIRLDPRTGTVDVAVADGRNPHAATEIGYFLGAPVRPVRARLTTLLAAIQKLEEIERSPQAPPVWAPPPSGPRPALVPKETPLWGTPIVTLDKIKRDSSPPSVEMPIPLLRPIEDPDTLREPEPTFDLVPSQRIRPAPLPLPDLGPLLASLRTASDRDSILAIVLSGVHGLARRVAILVSKKDAYVGWSCSPEFGSAKALRNVSIPTNVSSILATAAAGGMYLGPIYEADTHVPLLAIMGTATRDVAVCSVKVLDKTAMLILADELTDSALSTKHMDAIATAAGQALTRLLRRRA